jgi:hypothetical protein
MSVEEIGAPPFQDGHGDGRDDAGGDTVRMVPGERKARGGARGTGSRGWEALRHAMMGARCAAAQVLLGRGCRWGWRWVGDEASFGLKKKHMIFGGLSS